MTLQLPCRFTDRNLEVKPHGPGVKLTIVVPDFDGTGVTRRTSVHLGQADIQTLARELGDYDAPLFPAAKSAPTPATLEDALRGLADVLHRHGF